MGPGLLILLLVVAWLAVLVPMALRSHDNSTAFRSSEDFGVAMRTLGRRAVLVPRRGASFVVSRTKTAREPVAKTRLTARQRRLRTLLALVATAVVTLLLAVLVSPLFWVAQAVVDVLLFGFVWHLRRMELARRALWHPLEEGWDEDWDDEQEQEQEWVPVRIAGIPDRMPLRPSALTAPLPAAAARYEDAALPASVAAGWAPVPVPPPVYVGKAVAPTRPQRVLDLTQPGAYDPESGAAEDDELEDILDRRAAGDW